MKKEIIEMSADELRSELKKRGIKFSEKARANTLMNLLAKNIEKGDELLAPVEEKGPKIKPGFSYGGLKIEKIASKGHTKDAYHCVGVDKSGNKQGIHVPKDLI